MCRSIKNLKREDQLAPEALSRQESKRLLYFTPKLIDAVER